MMVAGLQLGTMASLGNGINNVTSHGRGNQDNNNRNMVYGGSSNGNRQVSVGNSSTNRSRGYKRIIMVNDHTKKTGSTGMKENLLIQTPSSSTSTQNSSLEANQTML